MNDAVTQNNNDSILNSIKRLLGIIPETVTAFDQEIIIHINTVFGTLTSMGVGPINGFKITDSNDTWSSFIDQCHTPEGVPEEMFEDVKTFIYMKVKLIFDPPSSASLLDSYNNLIKEIEYRLYTRSGGY